MSLVARQTEPLGPAAEFHLLGRVDFDDCLALQRRLVYEAGGRNDGRIEVLFCEHPPLITVGRAGSRGHIRLTNEELARRQLQIRWVSRGGGCVLHGPGQLAVYPIVPLDWHGWTVGEYMRRLQAGIVRTREDMNVRGETRPGRFGVGGRSGHLAAVGVAVRDGVASHGAFINVNPAMSTFSFIDVVTPETAAFGEKTTMGCLLAERQQAVKMTAVRAALVANLAAALGCARHHLHTGHPLLSTTRRMSREVTASAC
jgi:lipoyl(octanoyl) transferase